jgi:hypothetical protein
MLDFHIPFNFVTAVEAIWSFVLISLVELPSLIIMDPKCLNKISPVLPGWEQRTVKYDLTGMS